ncbi:hypothetical protein D3C72_2087550 [compost metagenome]
MVAAGQLRHHAAVFGVHRHLRVQLVGNQAAFGVVQRDAGFVARRFNSQYEHVSGFKTKQSFPFTGDSLFAQIGSDTLAV